MDAVELRGRYEAYVACLNRRDWRALAGFAAPTLRYNGEEIGDAAYVDMLVGNVRDIPDLAFRIDRLVVEPPMVASRLWFDCTPVGRFLGLDVDGRRVSFAEHVLYRFDGAGAIEEVWSVIDKAAIEAQLRG